MDEWGILSTVLETTAHVKARKAMELLEEQLVLAQEASGSGTWDWDIEAGVLHWSPEFFRLFGLDLEKHTASFETWRSTLHPDDAKRAEEKIAQSIRERASLESFYRIIVPPGEIRWILARGNTRYDGAGNPKRMSGICIDITSRIAIEEELKSHRENLEKLVHERTVELEAANRDLESFSYSVSHDLRAPLRAMDGFASILLEEYPDRLDENGRQYLDRIKAAARRMSELINNLLELARLSRRELAVTSVDLSALARDVAADLHASAPARDVEFRIQDGMAAKGDPSLLRIVLENLLGNSFKFTSRRPRAVIETGSRVQGGVPVFFVKDNGAGFDAAWAGKLFTPFQRLHAGSEFPGTGIGLATVHRIITRHRGRIWPEATVDGGACFYFTIGGA